MNALRILSSAAFLALLAGCSSQSAERTTEAIFSPITAPINSAVNNSMPLPQTSQYTYWKRTPGTNLYEAYVSDHPLSEEEQDKLGILRAGATPAPAPAPAAAPAEAAK